MRSTALERSFNLLSQAPRCVHIPCCTWRPDNSKAPPHGITDLLNVRMTRLAWRERAHPAHVITSGMLRALCAGVLQEHEGLEADAEYAAMLAEKLAAAPPRGAALFQNIQHGGRQSLTGGAQTLLSKPSMRAALAAKARSAAQLRLRTLIP